MGQLVLESQDMNSPVLAVFSLGFIFTTTLATNQIEVSSSWSRQLGFCCGSVATKCAQGCAGKNCDVQCSGTCGILSTTCTYTCSQVTNACSNTAATPTAAATTAAASTAAATTAAATT